MTLWDMAAWDMAVWDMAWDATAGAAVPTTVTIGGGWADRLRLARGGLDDPARPLPSGARRFRTDPGTPGSGLTLTLSLRSARLPFTATGADAGTLAKASHVVVAMTQKMEKSSDSLLYRSRPMYLELMVRGWVASEKKKSRSIPNCSASWRVACVWVSNSRKQFTHLELAHR
jgi:hypothetical protein